MSQGWAQSAKLRMTIILLDPASPQTQSAETTETRLSHIESLLNSDPAQAEIQASELLNLVPGEQMAILFQGIARRLVGNFAAAIEVLQPLSENCPEAPFVHLQLGLALRDSGQRDTARNSIRRAVSVKVAARFVQVERRINNLLEIQVARGVPFVE